MADLRIQFNDGAAYDQLMGRWSRLVGDIFLDWLAPAPGLRWIDIGCGSGMFTELIIERCAPTEVQGIDPSGGQLDFARTRPAARVAQFRQGDAMALPFLASSFDVAVMALVIFFVSDPVKGVTEMVRVVRPGGTVATYAWDMFGGGFPGEPIRAEMKLMGLTPPEPPRSDASRMAALREMWVGAGLREIETKEITVRRTFADFDDFWTLNLRGASVGPTIMAMPPSEADLLKARVRTRLPTDGEGRITYASRANAIKGRTPK